VVIRSTTHEYSCAVDNLLRHVASGEVVRSMTGHVVTELSGSYKCANSTRRCLLISSWRNYWTRGHTMDAQPFPSRRPRPISLQSRESRTIAQEVRQEAREGEGLQNFSFVFGTSAASIRDGLDGGTEAASGAACWNSASVERGRYS
jgi:hypothetical protein